MRENGSKQLGYVENKYTCEPIGTLNTVSTNNLLTKLNVL